MQINRFLSAFFVERFGWMEGTIGRNLSFGRFSIGALVSDRMSSPWGSNDCLTAGDDRVSKLEFASDGGV